MLYRSTKRQSCNQASSSFEDAVLKGCAADGGLLMPETIPKLTLNTLQSWSTLSYPDIVFEIAKLYIDPVEIPVSELKKIIDDAYQNDFPSEVIPIVELSNSTGLCVAELYHGPTMAFKDLSVACMGQFLQYFLNKRQKFATVLVATSGDTGGSVIQAFKSLTSVDTIVMFPKGRCNAIQELQMTTVISDNIHCFEVEGTSDDEDAVMSSILSDENFVTKHGVTVANSINWSRLMIQVANFIYIYLKSGITIGDTLHLIIPTGGAGNATGACIAHCMGLPILITLAVNSNDCIHRCLISDGHFRVPKKTAIQTLASAMDIQIPYNLERMIDLFATDVSRVKNFAKLFEEFREGKDFVVPNDILHEIQQVVISSHCIDDKKILETIHRCYKEDSYLICPHTATAIACFYASGTPKNTQKSICIATASPMKFPDVLQAAGVQFDKSRHCVLEMLQQQPSADICHMKHGEDWSAILRKKIEDITKNRVNNVSKILTC